jgi:hypothetical protein
VLQPLAVGEIRGGALPRAVDHGLEALVVEGLEQVVHGLKLERRDGVLVEGGGEDDGGAVPHSLGDLEPAQPRDGEVQQHDVRSKLVDEAERGGPVLRLTHDTDVGKLLRERAELLPGQLLVVGDDQGQRHGGVDAG